MSLGLGIFLSTLIVGLLLLQRWGYLRKIAKYGLLFVAAVAVIGAGFWGYNLYKNRPTKQNSYLDLSLGMNMDEVQYVKWWPNAVLEKTEDPEWKNFLLVHNTADIGNFKKNDIENYFCWYYKSTSSQYAIDVNFSPETKKVTEISCSVPADSGDYGSCRVLGIATGWSEEEIYERLGKPDSQKLGGLSKTIIYSNLNLKITLVRKKAYYITVTSQAGSR